MRFKTRFHGLRRPRIRQTWNKYNLYNMQANSPPPRILNKTFFQQKWIAKSLTRGYHGEHINERQWERMFSRHLASVVEMNPTYLAAFDGSEQAAGRGSGRQTDPDVRLTLAEQLRPEAGTNRSSNKATPYMQMTFAPLERRLDTAIFRAMFASSTRQARQFVVHGAVTVNGKKMTHPSYLLNPGDMFQVDIERVLFATGAKKPTRRAEVRKRLAMAAEEEAQPEEEAQEEAAEAADAADAAEEGTGVMTAANKRALRQLPYLAARAKDLLSDSSKDLSVKRKKALRQFVKDARKWVSKASMSARASEGSAAATSLAAPPVPSSNIVAQLADLLAGLPPIDGAKGVGDAQAESSPSLLSEAGAEAKTKSGRHVRPELTVDEHRRFEELMAREAENPYDPSKPYATPWRPRPFMQAFACIPQYLEVNQNICAAVYLRHPVSRPGSAEIPTPFPQEINQLAFNYYLRRH